MTMVSRRVAAVAALLLLLAQAAFAQPYPSRQITLVVPFAPGGPADFLGRLIGLKLGEELGQQMVVDNRAGANTIIGAQAVAKAKPDGYTLLVNSTALAANPVLFKNVPYDSVKDLAPVSLLATVPTVLVVHPGFAAASVSDLIAQAKAKPGALNYGSAGNGSGNHLTTEVFMHAAGISAQHVPYKGGGAVMADLVGGQINFVFAVLPTAHPFITSGKLKALAVTSPQRNSALPNVPTVAEAALPGFSVMEWLGLFTTAGTPAPVVERLNAAASKALQHPEVVERFKALGADIAGGPPARLDAYYKGELDRWATLAREVKFQVE
jgi:tripartite-type tricarboxylate transporter receptor subunit TctC